MKKPRSVSRARRIRRTSRAVLAFGVVVALFVPVSWERLPDFGAVYVPRAPDGPAPEPGPGIDPEEPVPGPEVIVPEGPIEPSSSGVFTYLEFFGDQPPFLSTCEPIPFEIRTETAPANGAELIFEAIQELANTTGLSFRFVGYTDDVYSFNERKTRYSWERDWDPLWIGWATSDEVPDLGPKAEDKPYAVGVGGPVAYERGNGQWEILGGGVVLRAGEPIPAEFGPGATLGNVLLHELGHAFGLDHVDSRAELLYPTLLDDGPDRFGPGDAQGLQGLTTACDR